MEDLLNEIDKETLPSQAREVKETLMKIMRNIVQNPGEAKFKMLKKENKMVSEKILKCKSAVSLLLAVGFEDTGATFMCPATADLETMQVTVDLLEALLLSSPEPAPAAADPAPAPAAARAPAAAPAAAKPQAHASVNDFKRRDDVEKRRKEEADQMQALRAAKASGYSSGAAAQPPVAAQAAEPEDRKKPLQSAFNFESRAKKEEEKQKAVQGAQDLRALQKEKYKEFQANPDAKKSEAYQAPPSVANGGKEEKGWFSDWFGGGSSSNNDKPKPPPPGGGGARVKGLSDLPKPVQRGG
eukprot:gnl/TRDRNA2_/TRDRNA2_187334_c0_seq1.p1 gnl/TRDRNA2_/TRDRNA2_187334_c0~~gnl/TRDRNA2_/TRDRNA2_187334_c0_seq1.p1  ORF type:complete len:299 (-),score=110.76 gnl/TRDRNA2_/TRDRNA2_187334_c0_seq1:117-1013(-)